MLQIIPSQQCTYFCYFFMFDWLSDGNPENDIGLSGDKMGCLGRPECPYFMPWFTLSDFFSIGLDHSPSCHTPPPIRKKCNPDGQTAGRTDRMMTIGTVSVNIGKYLFIIVTCNFLHNININIMVINNRICRANLAYNVTLYKDIANKNVYSVPRRQTLGLQI